MKKQLHRILATLILVVGLTGCTGNTSISETTTISSSVESVESVESVDETEEIEIQIEEDTESVSLVESINSQFSVIEYADGDTYAIINNNIPDFNSDEKELTDAFETYAELDELGRCGVAYANICKELMPTEDREGIGHIKPSGWQSVKYDIVDGKYLYNRCHLIGFQLAGENANELNLITGTRQLNVDAMLFFENDIANYVEETGNHVLYRVTPVFNGDDLVASYVQLEGFSVEDNGDGICFNVICYNMQDGIEIDYSTGESWLKGEKIDNIETTAESVESGNNQVYVLNINSGKFHKSSCSEVKRMKPENKKEFNCSRDQLLDDGYTSCGKCKP